MTALHHVLPVDRWSRVALAIFLALWAASCIHVPYPKYFWLQHVPTVAVIVLLIAVQNRLQISCLSYTLILAFMLLHVLGARYLYSYVPYDDWFDKFFGYRITDRFDFTRNHYDRVVHFFFGLLLIVPAWRFSQRVVGTTAWWSAVFAFSVIMAASAVYEVFEWLVAVVMAPDGPNRTTASRATYGTPSATWPWQGWVRFLASRPSPYGSRACRRKSRMSHRRLPIRIYGSAKNSRVFAKMSKTPPPYFWTS